VQFNPSIKQQQTYFKKSLGDIYVSLAAELLGEVSKDLGRPGTGHMITSFLGFPFNFKQMLKWFPSSELLLNVPHAVLPILIHQS
jgi:hypothetical protein